MHLAPQEGHRDARLGIESLRCKHIQIGALVLRVGEISHLDEAFLYQSFQAVIGLAEAYAQVLGQLALGDVGVLLKMAQRLEVDFLVDGPGLPR